MELMETAEMVILPIPKGYNLEMHCMISPKESKKQQTVLFEWFKDYFKLRLSL